jgi:cell division protein FtsN
MKRIFLLMIISAFLLPGCKFLNEKVFKKRNQAEAYTQKLEQELEAKDAQYEMELAEIKQISQAKIDSIINYYENELTKGPQRGAAGAGTYYLVVGSFKTPEYAESYADKISKMGYTAEIVTYGYWNFVSAESYTNLREALAGLEIVRTGVTPGSWIFVGK